MKNLPTAFTYLAAALVSSIAAAADDKTTELPEYPKQPSVNAALKHLSAAQKNATDNKAAAIESLGKAIGSLEHAIKDKGTYRQSAIRLANQAIKHLEKSDADTALHEIAEAIDFVNKAGKAGARL